MNKRKKKAIYVCTISICVLFLLFVVVYDAINSNFVFKKEKKSSNTTKNVTYKQEDDRQDKINKFTEQNTGGNDVSNSETNTNGYKNVYIKNRTILKDQGFVTLDNMLSINNYLEKSLTCLKQSLADIKKYNDRDYYTNNLNLIWKAYGIENKSDFLTFIDKFSKLKNTDLSYAVIDQQSIEKVDDTICFNLSIYNSVNETVQVSIKTYYQGETKINFK